MDLSNWKFRKALEKMETYGQTRPFRVQIEKGNREVLNMIVREMEILLSEPNENPFSKFLCLRFCRQMMLIGDSHIITAMQRLIPSILKVCSYRLDSNDPSRGTTYFSNHPQYKKADNAQKQNLNMVGSSLLIICLESIRTWATWIPVASNGIDSVFKKAYDSLRERGVTFCQEDKYYKPADKEKFFNTYKVEFFEQSLVAEQPSEDENTFVQRQLQIMQNLRKQLIRLQSWTRSNAPPNPSALPEELQKLRRKIHLFHSSEISKLQRAVETSCKNEYEKKKKLERLFSEQEWCELFLKGYTQLNSKKINLLEFFQMCNKQSKLTDRSEVEVIEIKHLGKPKKEDTNRQIKLQLTTNMVSSNLSTNQGNQQIRMREGSQEARFKEHHQAIIQKMQMEISRRNEQIQKLRLDSARVQTKIRQQYQHRIIMLKQSYAQQAASLAASSIAATAQKQQIKSAQRQMHELRDKLNQAQQNSRLRIREQEQKYQHVIEANNKMSMQLDECSKQLNKRQNKIGELLEQLQLEKENRLRIQDQLQQLRQSSKQYVQSEKRMLAQRDGLQSALERETKQNRNLRDELVMTKEQLQADRQKSYIKNDEQMARMRENTEKMKIQLQQYKNIVEELKSQLRRLQLELQQKQEQRQMTERRLIILETSRSPKQENPLRDLSSINGTVHQSPAIFHRTLNSVKEDRWRQLSPMGYSTQGPMMLGMQDFYRTFTKMSRESYYRFCKACLKNKELLYKQNEFQVGVICQKLSKDRLKVLMHYTNNAQQPLQNFKAKIFSPRNIKTTITVEAANRIEPTEQEKQEMVFQVYDYPTNRIYLEITYDKQDKKQSLTLLIPMLLVKMMSYSTIKGKMQPNKILQHRQFIMNSRVIPHSKDIRNYIVEFTEVTPGTYEVWAQHPTSMMQLFIRMAVADGKVDLKIMGGALSAQQTALMSEFVNGFQMVLSK